MWIELTDKSQDIDQSIFDTIHACFDMLLVHTLRKNIINLILKEKVTKIDPRSVCSIESLNLIDMKSKHLLLYIATMNLVSMQIYNSLWFLFICEFLKT